MKGSATDHDPDQSGTSVTHHAYCHRTDSRAHRSSDRSSRQVDNEFIGFVIAYAHFFFYAGSGERYGEAGPHKRVYERESYVDRKEYIIRSKRSFWSGVKSTA